MYPRHEMLELIVVDGRARGIVARDLVTRRDPQPPRRRRRARLRRLRQRLLPLHERQGLQRHGELARAPQGRAVRQPLLHADPPDVHPGERRPPVEAHADERVAAQRRPGLGAEEGRRRPGRPATSRRPSATTSWSASTRRSATWCPATSPAAPRRTSATRAAASGPTASASTSTSPTRSRGWAARPSRRSTGTCSRCTSASPARTRTRCRCGSTRPCTTRWAGCGSTTTCRARSPACSWSARRTSPTTAPTGSARPR